MNARHFNMLENMSHEQAKECLQKLKTGYADRMFDHIVLLSDVELNKLTDDFKKIFLNVRLPFSRLEENNLSKLLSYIDKKNIDNFINPLIQKACQELLEQNGSLKFEIKKLIGIEEQDINLDIRKIICAYVGAACQQMMAQENFINLIKNNLKVYDAICVEINKYGRLVVTYLNKNYNYQYVEKNESFDSRNILFISDAIKKQIETHPIEIILGSLGLLAFAGLTLYKTFTSPSSSYPTAFETTDIENRFGNHRP